MDTGRFVIDTNTLVSRLLLPDSLPAKAVHKAISAGDLLFSAETLADLNEVLIIEQILDTDFICFLHYLTDACAYSESASIQGVGERAQWRQSK